MATAQAALTPTTNTAPAVVSIPAADPSGAHWCARFPGSAQVSDCVDPFKANITSFLAALNTAGASVTISATYRPPQRAYLMHWSWMIVFSNADPRTIPAMAGVNIHWDHLDAAGAYLAAGSLSAAQDMVNGYSMQNLNTAPALDSRHIRRSAIDMSLSWNGTLSIVDATGTTVAITATPRSGMNADLATVGTTFGAIKYNGSGVDRPHWSDTGR